MRRSHFSTSLLAVALAGCGEGGAGGGGGPTGPGASWTATDACQVLKASDLSRAIGEPVSAAKRESVVENEDTGVRFSTCTYTLKDGGQVAFLARQSADPDNTPAAIARTRQETVATMGPVEDVAGVGAAAFWLPRARQLVVFVGKDRYFNLTMPARLGGKDPKTLALAIASELD